MNNHSKSNFCISPSIVLSISDDNFGDTPPECSKLSTSL